MTSRSNVLIALAFALAAAACGSEIGDSCLISTDCSQTGERVCDLSQEDGYCTVVGCDYDTCPGEAVCVRFFVGEFSDKACDPVTEDIDSDDCSLDELCALRGFCVPRSAEARYCMKKCDGGGCRDGYECREEDLMVEHGGEPVLPPGERPDGNLQGFCAQAPFE